MKELNDEFLFTRILTIMFLIFWRSHWKVSSTWFLKQLITIMKLLLQGLSVECGMSTGCLKIYKKVRTNFGQRDYLSNCLFRVSKINSRRQRSTTTESSFQPTEGDLTLTCLGVNFKTLSIIENYNYFVMGFWWNAFNEERKLCNLSHYCSQFWTVDTKRPWQVES